MLNQLEEQYKSLATDAMQKWDAFNQDLTNHMKEVKLLASAQLEELKKTIAQSEGKPPSSSGVNETTAAGATSTQQVIQAASTGDEAAQRMLAQLDHRAEVQLQDLRELDLEQAEAEELSHLAHLWAVSEVYGLEDQMAVVTFADTILHPAVFAKLLGTQFGTNYLETARRSQRVSFPSR